MTCKFASGPLAGQTRSYRNAGAAPLAEGAPCTDGAGSIGVAVPDATTPAPGAVAAAPEGRASRCNFTAGPKSGQSGALSKPSAIGSDCTDGQGSRGVAR